MRETVVESHPFRKVREKDGAPGKDPKSQTTVESHPSQNEGWGTGTPGFFSVNI